MEFHIKAIHLGHRPPSQRGKFKCNICSKEFIYKSSIPGHNKRLHINKQQNCSICNLILPTKYDADQHYKKNHMNEKKCHICNKMFTSKHAGITLRAHVLTVHALGRFRCNKCKLTFDLEEDFKKHVHVTQLKCEVCEKYFQNKLYLAKHVKSLHTGKRFSCKECKKLFTTKASLKRHSESVHDEVRYSCGKCDISYSEKVRLNNHLKSAH